MVSGGWAEFDVADWEYDRVIFYGGWVMKFFAMLAVTALMFSGMAVSAEAQWGYRPVRVSPRYPVRVYSPRYVTPVSQAPVRVSRSPVVVYEPMNVVYSRRRPILGGYSVRVRPAYRRMVMW